jgi:uncharacterized protein YdaU (DUF1376 family)
VSAPAPAFMEYSRDVTLRIAALTLEERGLYWSLRLWSWTEGPLPVEPGRLARIVGVSLQKFRQLFPTVLPLLQERDGKYVCPDLEAQRDRYAEVRKAKSAAAKTRWGLEREKASNGADSPDARASHSHMHTQCSSVAVAVAGTKDPSSSSVKGGEPRAPTHGQGGGGGASPGGNGNGNGAAWADPDAILAIAAWGDTPAAERRALLPQVLARRTAPVDPSITPAGAVRYVLNARAAAPKPGTEAAFVLADASRETPGGNRRGAEGGPELVGGEGRALFARVVALAANRNEELP